MSATEDEASLQNLRRRAAEALARLQRQSERRGLDRLTLDEVNAEIGAARVALVGRNPSAGRNVYPI